MLANSEGSSSDSGSDPVVFQKQIDIKFKTQITTNKSLIKSSYYDNKLIIQKYYYASMRSYFLCQDVCKKLRN